MATPSLSADDVPSWATPEAWEESEQVVDRAEAHYREIAKKLDLEKNAFGKFVIV